MRGRFSSKQIIGLCMVLISVFSLFILYKTMRPSRGLPFEELTLEQAAAYMEYEAEYILLDVSGPDEFEARHLPGALNIPADTLVKRAAAELPDPDALIYVCSQDPARSRSAAYKLCELGYTNITEIVDITGYKALTEAET